MKEKPLRNPERVKIEGFIDRHGPEKVLAAIKQIFADQLETKRTLTPQERQLMNHFLGNTHNSNLKEKVRSLFTTYGGAAIIEALIALTEDLSEEYTDDFNKKRLKKMGESLKLKSVRRQWYND